MGAETFVTTRFAFDGITARQAFKDAQEEARHDYGHRGYTGTVAEKQSFVELPLVDGKDIFESAWHYIRECDPRIDDKWGPAGCVKGKDKDGYDVYCFFGWASA